MWKPLLAAATGLALAMTAGACSSKVAGDDDNVVIKAGALEDPEDKAQEHCAKFGKAAILTGNSSAYHNFRCE